MKDQTLAALLDQSDGILKVLANRHDAARPGPLRRRQGHRPARGRRGGPQDRARLDPRHRCTRRSTSSTATRTTSTAPSSWIGTGAYGLSLAPSHGSWADVYVRAIGPDVIGLLGALAGGNAMKRALAIRASARCRRRQRAERLLRLGACAWWRQLRGHRVLPERDLALQGVADPRARPARRPA